MGLAPILAPFIGGQLLVHFGWRSVFFVLAGYGAHLVRAGGVAAAREPAARTQRRRESVTAIAATYLRILRDREYLGWVLSGGLVFAGLLAYISGSSFVFIELFHVSPERFGLYFGTNAIGLMIASQINRYLASTRAPRGDRRHGAADRGGRRRDAARGRLHGLRRLCRHPGAALLLHRVPRLRGPEHDGAGHEPVRRRGGIRVGAHGHAAVRARGRRGRTGQCVRQRHGGAVCGRHCRLRLAAFAVHSTIPRGSSAG